MKTATSGLERRDALCDSFSRASSVSQRRQISPVRGSSTSSCSESAPAETLATLIGTTSPPATDLRLWASLDASTTDVEFEVPRWSRAVTQLKEAFEVALLDPKAARGKRASRLAVSTNDEDLELRVVVNLIVHDRGAPRRVKRVRVRVVRPARRGSIVLVQARLDEFLPELP